MESYTNKHNRHDIYVGKLASHLLNEYAYPNLEAAYKAARLILLDSDNITSLTKLNKITAAINAAIKPMTNEMWSSLTNELDELAVYESNFYADMFKTTNEVELAIPAASIITSAVSNSLMTLTSGQSVKSDVWSNYIKANANSVTDSFNAQIRAGFSNDETLNQITKRLKNISEGILKRNAEALVRTGTSHYANSAREKLMQANKKLIPKKYYNATFDNRTTLICRANNSNPDNPWAIDDKKAPTLPAHWNCRSNWLYLIKGQTHPDGTRQAVGGVQGKEAREAYEKRADRVDGKVKYRGKKDTNIFKPGQILGGTSMDDWMMRQPKYFIESSLGKGRAELFMSGKVSLTGFVDAVGKPISLAELKASGI